MKISPPVPCDEKSRSNKYFYFLPCKFRLRGSNSANLCCNKAGVIPWTYCSVCQSRERARLFRAESISCCSVCTALSTTKPCCGAEDFEELVQQKWKPQPKGRLGHKEGYQPSSEHISKHFINWDTMRCGPRSPQFIQVIHAKSWDACALKEAVQVQPFPSSCFINILAQCHGSGALYRYVTHWKGLFVSIGANNKGILLSPDDKLSSLPPRSHGSSL